MATKSVGSFKFLVAVYGIKHTLGQDVEIDYCALSWPNSHELGIAHAHPSMSCILLVMVKNVMEL